MKEKKKIPAWRAWLRWGMLAVLLVAIGVMARCYETAEPVEIAAPAPLQTQQPDERSLREAAYDKDIQALENLLQSGAADADTQQAAAARLERMIADHQSELAVEEALNKAGYSTALVLLQNNALTVLLSAHTISAEAGAAILNLCTAHTDIPPENIRIMPSAS